MLEGHGVRIGMDGKGRFMDNIFIERLWRSLKSDEVDTKAYDSVAELRAAAKFPRTLRDTLETI